MGKGMRLGALAGILGSAIGTYHAYQEGGWGRVKISWTGYDENFGWNFKWATNAHILGMGIGASFLASKTGVNRYTPKGLNI